MIRISKSFNFIIAFLLLITTSYSQQSGLIYDQVMDMQKEFPQKIDEVFSNKAIPQIPSDANNYVGEVEYFTLKKSFEQRIESDKPNTLFIEIPFEGERLQAQLYKKDVTTANYKVKAVSGAETKISNSTFYRGVLKGKPNSIVSLSQTSNGLRMTIHDGKVNFEINRIDNDLYAAYRVSESKHSQNTSCSTNHDFLFKKEGVKINKSSGSRSGECVEIYIECDFASYNTNGASIQNTEDWALSIMNEVGILYENIGVPLVVSDMLVYDVADPYLAGSDAGDILDLMGSVIGNNYNGRLAHVFTTRSVGGGIAWVDVLCDVNSGGSFGPYAVSGSMNPGAIPFPIFSWNVMVVAHELGHNVGSLHTHDCVWNGNNTQIDDCGNQETDQGDDAVCYDENNPILPAAGTIMSYCHLVGSVGIDFNQGFHPQVGNLLLDHYLGAPCVTGENCGSGGTPPIADFTYNQLNPCTPVEVQFTDLSENNPTSHLWDFPGGNPSASIDPNPFVIYDEPGFYNVSLTVSNFSGEDVLFLAQIIEVGETPIPDFDNIIEDGLMKFTNQTSGSVSGYFWDFGDGNSSTEENPCHEYEEDGSYPVTLSVTSICGDFEVENYVDFFTPPIAAFEADTTFGCSPLVVNYTNNSSENTLEYKWSFEGGNPVSSTEENPTVEYASSGSFEVVLIVSNTIGEDTLSISEYITVDTVPVAGFEFDMDSLEVVFTNTSENYDSLMWDFGDGNTSTETNPTHTYEEEGTFEVSLMVSNDCDTVTMNQTIVLSSLPTANYTVSQTEGCLPLTVVFTKTSSLNSDTWKWTFTGGTPAMSTEENPTVIYNQAGSFDVKLVVSNESGIDSLVQADLIVVEDIPSADFDFMVDGLNVEFNDLSTGYNSLSWDFGDENTSTQTNPTHTYAQDGTYEVILMATNDCGSNTFEQTITVSSLPTANFSANTTSDCTPMVVTFTNSSSSNATSSVWRFPGGNPSESTEQNPVVTYETAGVYDVSLIVSSGAGNDTLIFEDYITSISKPIANFEYTALSDFEYSFTSFSIYAESYAWDFGDEETSIEENPTHIFELPGIYDVVLSVSNSCGEEIHKKMITVMVTSINEIGSVKDVKVYPNPNRGEFILSLNSLETGDVELEIYNMLGQSILTDEFQINSGVNNKSIRLENPGSGVYLLLLRSENQSYVSKVFLE